MRSQFRRCCSNMATKLRYGYPINMVAFLFSASIPVLMVATAAAFVQSSIDNMPALLQKILLSNQFEMYGQPLRHNIISNTSMCYDNNVSAAISESNNMTLHDSFFSTKKSTGSSNVIHNALHSTTEETCRVYMAPSTIPGAGYGLFAGVTFRSGDLVTPGDGVVPIHNPVFHNGGEEHVDTFLWDEYVWSASTFTAMDIPNQGMEAASFGIGALPNCYFALLNVEDSASHGRDNSNLERINSPGIGAFTPWHDRRSYATKDIHAGSELYVDYGYAYFTSRMETFGYVPFLNDYKVADQLLQRISNITDNFGSERTSLAPHMLLDDFYQLSRTILDSWPNRVSRALPKNSAMIANVLRQGGTIRQDYLRSIRNLDYLRTYGACMDHLYVEPSKLLPDAGRGVFTSRSFTKGSVVTTVPLIHIPDRKVMAIYGESTYNHGSDGPARNESNPLHQQLLLNYCYGHNQSSLLLCPYGIVSSLINHAPNVMDQGDHQGNWDQQPIAANVMIQWSAKITKNPEWWNMSISTWAYLYSAGLAFEYIALRDINAEEEILIDYGIEWQIAWEQHVVQWQPAPRLVDKLNENIDSVIPTSNEWVWPIGDININPQAVNLWCYDIYRTMQGFSATDEVAYPCKVTLRLYNNNTSSYIYIAEIFERRQNSDGTLCNEIFDEVLWSLPRDAFAYGGQNEVYDTNQYLMPTAFRHEIGIPDSILPPAWKNLRS